MRRSRSKAQGHPERFLELWSRADDVSIMAAIGGYQVGFEQVSKLLTAASKTQTFEAGAPRTSSRSSAMTSPSASSCAWSLRRWDAKHKCGGGDPPVPVSPARCIAWTNLKGSAARRDRGRYGSPPDSDCASRIARDGGDCGSCIHRQRLLPPQHDPRDHWRHGRRRPELHRAPDVRVGRELRRRAQHHRLGR